MNNIRKKCAEYKYVYGKTLFNLSIYAAGFKIETDMTTHFDSAKNLLTHKYFDDALRKGMLAFLIHNSKTINIDSVTVNIDGQELTLSDEEKSLIDSSWLVEVERDINFGGKDDVENIVTYLLNWKRSSSDSRISALFAYICAKSYEYETQKLQFNWMAMNGLYGFLASKIYNILIKKCGFKPTKNLNDALQFEWMMAAFGFINNIKPNSVNVYSDIRKKLVYSTDKIIEGWDGNGKPKQEFYSDIQRAIDTVLNNNSYRIDSYGFLLFELSYYLRCSIFHADYPVNLLARDNDFSIKRMKLSNKLMDSFLSDYLAKFFNDSFVNEMVDKFQNATFQNKVLYFTKEEQQ